MDTTALANLLEPHRNCRRWSVAYSGGVDSRVLLHLLSELCRDSGWPALAAVHVNHQLYPSAAQWVEHSRAVCAQAAIELQVKAVRVERDSGYGLEAAARAARYAAFAEVLGEGELLLQAHHLDDQVETLLLRLLRGAGLAGLAAIPAARPLGRGQLLRPLLHYPRRELLRYAQQHDLTWIHDDSNDNVGFDRNFIRHRIAPLLAERWPAYRDTLGRAAAQAAEADELVAALAEIDLATAQSGSALSASICLSLSPARQRNLLRHWLRRANLPPPSREQLNQILAQMSAPEDAEVCVEWPGAEVRRYRDGLYAMTPLPALPETVDIEWTPPAPLPLVGLGQLTATAAVGNGLRADRSYRVRSRQGGERCKPLGRAHSQTLKKLLQEAEIAPWLRDRLPLVFCGDELAAVADLWVCEGFQPAPESAGWFLSWRL